MPGGSWKETAREYTYVNGVLKAELKNEKGEWKYSFIKCRLDQEVTNQNGKFKKTKTEHKHELYGKVDKDCEHLKARMTNVE